MLKIHVGGVDVTGSVDFASLQLTEQLNNRRNVARFMITGTAVSEGRVVEIFKGAELTAGVSAGATVLPVSETYELGGFFSVGKEVRVGHGTASAEVASVASVDHVAKTVTLSAPLKSGHSEGDLAGALLFGGVTLKNPQEVFGKSDVNAYQVEASDFSALLDTKVVVDTYGDMYAREILGRAVYDFAADDARLDLNELETVTGVTYSGVATAPLLDTTESIYKLGCVKLGASGPGTATYRIPVAGAPADLSAFDRVRLWLKWPEYPEDSVSSCVVRLIDGAGNAFQWSDVVRLGPGWSYDSFDFDRAAWVGGTPSKATATYWEVEFVARKALTSGTIKADRVFATSGGFTVKGCERGNVLFKDVRAQYKKPSVFFEAIAKVNGFFWYVTPGRDVRFFDAENRPAPFSLTASSQNFGKLKVTADITNLKNRQVVRGGRAPQETIYTQTHVCDGQETSYRLDYPPKDLAIAVDTGGGFVSKTVGVENLVADSSVDFVFNFSEKTVRNGASPLLAAGAKIRLTYYPYKDVRVQVKDDASIAYMKALLGGDGIFDGAVINDASLLTFDEARARGRAELDAYSNAILTATFETEKDGLEAGQTVRITYPQLSVDADFAVQKVEARQKTNGAEFYYSVTAGSTMYGLTEFLQYLLKKTETGNVDAGEAVDIVQAVDEALILTDAIQNKKKTAPFYAHSRTGTYAIGLTFTEGGTSNDAYADFSTAS